MRLRGGVAVGWGGLRSHFHVQPNYSAEVVLRCVFVGVVTIIVRTCDIFYLFLSDKNTRYILMRM